MSVDNTHHDDDLLSTGDDTGVDDDSIDNSSTAIADEKEDLPGGSDVDPKKVAEQEQVDAWVKKIKADPTELSKLEASAQKWLAPKVKALLPSPPADPDQIATIAREVALKALEERDAKAREEKEAEDFKALKGTIEALKLPKAQLEVINSTLVSYKGKLGKLEALRLGAQLAQVDFEDTAGFRRAAALPKVGGGGKADDTPDLTKIDINKLSKPEREKLMAQGGMSRR